MLDYQDELFQRIEKERRGPDIKVGKEKLEKIMANINMLVKVMNQTWEERYISELEQRRKVEEDVLSRTDKNWTADRGHSGHSRTTRGGRGATGEKLGEKLEKPWKNCLDPERSTKRKRGG